jgi:hypothetical protein
MSPDAVSAVPADSPEALIPLALKKEPPGSVPRLSTEYMIWARAVPHAATTASPAINGRDRSPVMAVSPGTWGTKVCPPREIAGAQHVPQGKAVGTEELVSDRSGSRPVLRIACVSPTVTGLPEAVSTRFMLH